MFASRYFRGVSCIIFAISGSGAAAQVCPFEDQAHCQTPNGWHISPSDRLAGLRRLDDFRPAGSAISRVCWVPCWLGTRPNQNTFECSGSSGGTQPPDDFDLYVYEDDAGLPGLPVVGVPPGGYQLVVDDKAPDAPGWTRCWRYTAPLEPPLTVTPSECYWLEITGLGEDQAEGRCTLYWLESLDGNGFSISDADGVIDCTDAQLNGDVAWCFDCGIVGAIDPPGSQDGGCINIPVACCPMGTGCCPPESGCSNTTLRDCVGTTWNPLPRIPYVGSSCAELADCPLIANDDCTDAPVVCAGQSPDPTLGVCTNNPPATDFGEPCDRQAPDCVFAAAGAVCSPRPPGAETYRCTVPTDNRLATTDGPIWPEDCAFFDFVADQWFEYIAPCTGELTIHMCREPTDPCQDVAYLSGLQVFSSQLPGAACPCPADQGLSRACGFQFCGDRAAVELSTVEGACYLIRVGGWQDPQPVSYPSLGQGELEIGLKCAAAPWPALPAPAPFDVRKNRYLSFTPDPLGYLPVQYKITRVDPAPVAECGWVGPPGADGVSGLLPQRPAPRVWTETVVHVAGCAIVPGADYEIRATMDGALFSPPLAVSTIARPLPKFWGDTVGAFDGAQWTAPNGTVNTNDFLAALQKFQGVVTAPHVTVVDVVGAGLPGLEACVNHAGNISDVFNLIKAFQGEAYPYTTDPAACPVCP